MRVKAMSLIVMTLLSLANCVLAKQGTTSDLGGVVLEDPIFGFDYQPEHIHYEAVPVDIRSLCRLSGGTYWIHAKFTQGSADFYVIIGWRPDQDSDSFGTAVRIDGNKCEMDGSANIFSGFLPDAGYSANDVTSPLPGNGAPLVAEDKKGNYHYVIRSKNEEAVLRGLVRDATSRGEQAWGAIAFRQKVCPYDGTFDKHAPIIGDERRKYCGVS